MGTRAAPGPAASTASRSAARAAGLRLTSTGRSSALVLVLGLTVVGGVLRFATLDVQSVWLDESATLILVHRGFSGMLSHLSSSESTPPLYYVLVWAWTKVFGASPIAFRSFSALAGTLTIPVVYAAGREVSARAGAWAGALAVVSPTMFYYSQEARAYALLILLCGAAFVLWQRALREPAGRLAPWAAISVLAVLTHYFAAFLFIPEAVILIRRLGWRRVWAPAGVVVLAGIALAPLALVQRGDGKVSWIEASSLANRAGETVKQLLVGLYGPVEIATMVVAGLLVGGALVLLVRRGEEPARGRARDAAIVGVAAVALPLLLAVGHAVDVFDGRNVIAAWVPLAVVVAAGLAVPRAARAGAVLGTGLCALSLAIIVATELVPGYQRDDWRGVAGALVTPAGTRVIVGEQFAALPLSIYLRGVQDISTTGVWTREVDFVALRTRHAGGAPYPPVVPLTPPAGFRLGGIRRSEAFAVSRFLAPTPTLVRLGELRQLSEDSSAEVFTES